VFLLSETVVIPVVVKDGGKLPLYASEQAAGCDFYASESGVVKADEIVGLKRVLKESVNIPIDVFEDSSRWDELDVSMFDVVECPFNDPQAFKLSVKKHPLIVSTGIYVELPVGTELELRGRSGLGFKYSLAPHNGTIDADYRGEIKIKIYNFGNEDFSFEAGERICQGVIKRILRGQFEVAGELGDTVRGEGGFESTGRK
jgi:dUTP pyrophosphatase